MRNNATSTAIIDSAAFRTAVREYVAHYHAERNHHGLEGRLIEPQINAVAAGPIVCHERVGGFCTAITATASSRWGNGKRRLRLPAGF